MLHTTRNETAERCGSADVNLPFMSAGFRFVDCKPRMSSFRDAVIAGLSATPKNLDPKFFYDEAGSRLFEQICDLPEYYPTRTEMAILEQNVDVLHEVVGNNIELVEFGSGSSRKGRLMLDRLRPASYVAIDISREQLLQACNELSEIYPNLSITAVCADYSLPLYWSDDNDHHRRRLAFFPGSTIGNFYPDEALAFLVNVRNMVGQKGGLLIGVDLKKNAEQLNAAYNDSAGVTAAFNLNLLHRINRELQGDFLPHQFRHHAFYNEEAGRVEMHLLSLCEQGVHIGDRSFHFAQGESLHTENSYKYTVSEFHVLAAQAGFQARQVWQDEARLFSVHYLQAH